MPNYETGTSKYILGTATVHNLFPVDLRGREDVNCLQCNFFDRSRGRCYLTRNVSAYPDKWPAFDCPFREEYGGTLEVLENE